MGEKRRSDGPLPSDQGPKPKRHKGNDKHHHKHSSLNEPSRKARNYDLPKIPSSAPHRQPASTSAFKSAHKIPLPPIHDEKVKKAIFTHPNTRSNKDAGARDDTMTYEPLEFLGDAYIEVIATRLIHARFPTFNVGERSQCREMMVKNETLAEFSRAYGWDAPAVIKLSGREREDGGLRWMKILGDVFEAYVGGVVEDDKENGFVTAETWLHELWEPYLATLEKKVDANPRVNVGELKDKLQNLLMNPKAGVKIKFVDAVPPREDRQKGLTWFVREVQLTGWGHVNKPLGRGESANGKTADALAIQDAFTKHMDLIMEANALKKDFEQKAKEEKQKQEAAEKEES